LKLTKTADSTFFSYSANQNVHHTARLHENLHVKLSQLRIAKYTAYLSMQKFPLILHKAE